MTSEKCLVLHLLAGYLDAVALQAYCSNCQRTVYIEDGDTPVCPVCSSPLLETVEGEDSGDDDDDQPDGAK